ncbi:MAG: hypothetical protein WC369_00070 [Dehalococcoidales bacterium]|jgi:hypothetical protein
MEKYHHSITKYLYEEFENSAIAYLRTALEMFHKARKTSGMNSQPSIGNLVITIELMLKTLIVKHSPALLFDGLPDEIQALFACPGSLPKDFNWRPFDIELRSFNKYKTKKLNECIPLFYILLPQHKQELYSYFKLCSLCRNASVHAVLPSFQRFELERLGFLTLRLYGILVNTKNMYKYSYYLTENDKQFFLTYKSERIELVKKKIEEAIEKSKHITTGRASLSTEGWEFYSTECPICGGGAVLTGYTEIQYDIISEESPPDENLDFIADSFECDDCGLKLNDSAELKLARIDLHYDRSDELEQWHEDNYEPDPSDYM